MIWIFRHSICEPESLNYQEAPEWDPENLGLPAFPLGVAMVRLRTDIFPMTGPVYELFFYVRGCCRTANIGHETLPAVLAKLKVQLRTKPPSTLIARFPILGSTLPQSYRRSQWTTFFNDFDFVRNRKIQTGSQDICLQRSLE